MKTAFVAGATGYVGREVVRQLSERGVAVSAHLRPGSRSAARSKERFASWGAQTVEAAWQPEALVATLTDTKPEAVFCCIGTTRASARKDKLAAHDIYQAVDVQMTSMLVDAVVAGSRNAFFVYLSSVGANERRRSRYLAARGRAESLVIESGLPYVIARPSFIAGSGRDDPRRLEQLAAVVSDGLLALAGSLGARRLRDRLRSMDNVAVAAALIEASLDPASTNQVLGGEQLQALARRAQAAPQGTDHRPR